MKRLATLLLLWSSVAYATDYWQDQQNVNGMCVAPTMSISAVALEQSDGRLVCGPVPISLITAPTGSGVVETTSGAFNASAYTTVPQEVQFGAASGGGLAQASTWKFDGNKEQLGDGLTSSYRVQVCNTSFCGGYEWWRDATPSRAGAIDMSVPGSAPTNDLVVSTFNGTSWTESARWPSGGGYKVASLAGGSDALVYALAADGSLTRATPGTCTVLSSGTWDVKSGACGGTTTFGGAGQYLQDVTVDGYGKVQGATHPNLTALAVTKLHWMVLDNVPAALRWIVTSSTAFTGVAALEYPNDFLAGHIQTKANFIASVGAANFSCTTTRNGSTIGSTTINYTGSLGIQSTSVVTTGSASASDTYGLACAPAAGGGGTINFSYEVVLTP